MMDATKTTSGSQAKEDPPSAVSTGSRDAYPGPANEEDSSDFTYYLKWIPWNSGKIPIVMQSINGPCPLIAITNVLLLREKVRFPSMLEQVTESQLLSYLGECIMDNAQTDIHDNEDVLLNLEQNVHDAIEILPKLKTGLDVNVKYTGITGFEYTPACIIFDLLRITLYHGWLCDPDLVELQNVIRNQSYNQLIDFIITNRNSQDPTISTKVLIAEEFLETTASQLTLYGLKELKGKIKDNEIGILFRNNHFLTLFKRDNELYTLVTDQGYLTEDHIIWEILDNIEGAGNFFDSDFQIPEVASARIRNWEVAERKDEATSSNFIMPTSGEVPSIPAEVPEIEEARIAEEWPSLGESASLQDKKPNMNINSSLSAQKDLAIVEPELEEQKHEPVRVKGTQVQVVEQPKTPKLGQKETTTATIRNQLIQDEALAAAIAEYEGQQVSTQLSGSPQPSDSTPSETRQSRSNERPQSSRRTRGDKNQKDSTCVIN